MFEPVELIIKSAVNTLLTEDEKAQHVCLFPQGDDNVLGFTSHERLGHSEAGFGVQERRVHGI